MRNTVVSLAALALLSALGYLIHYFLTNKAPNPSPGEVVGGSIFLRWKQGYKPDDPCPSISGMICGHTDDATKLDFYNLNIPKTTASYGWIIHVDDPNGEALKVCSDSACAAKIGSPTTYYVMPRAGEVPDLNAKPSAPGATNEMHFHDNANCYNPGGTEDPKCDKAVYFSLDLGKADGTWMTGDKVSCTDPHSDPAKECRVLIGKDQN
jgi:hypothetical protein